ncbi:MAG: hypothetical protein QNL12_02505 [Acidimicrobiia bacterium]|nr:hypothetical protein [Acidimicrobiia bacterium]MDX2466159.1 hypothetical protein [Acidimicrobiia bacterium]
MNEIVYTFAGPHDARTYLRRVAILWSVWVVGLVVILLTHGVSLIFWSIGVLATIVLLARPLLTRAEALVPVNAREGNAALSALRGGTTRDRALRELAYGSEPVRAALDAAGLSRRWLFARHIVVAITLLGLVYVLFAPRS